MDALSDPGSIQAPTRARPDERSLDENAVRSLMSSCSQEICKLVEVSHDVRGIVWRVLASPKTEPPAIFASREVIGTLEHFRLLALRSVHDKTSIHKVIPTSIAGPAVELPASTNFLPRQ